MLCFAISAFAWKDRESARPILEQESRAENSECTTSVILEENGHCLCGALTNSFAKSMEQRPSWEANRSSATQEISRILWYPKVHYRIYKSPPPVRVRIHIFPVHAPNPNSLRSILILSSHLRLGLSRFLLPSGFPTKTLNTPLLSPFVLDALPPSTGKDYKNSYDLPITQKGISWIIILCTRRPENLLWRISIIFLLPAHCTHLAGSWVQVTGSECRREVRNYEIAVASDGVRFRRNFF